MTLMLMLCSQGQCYRSSSYRNTVDVTSLFHGVTESGTGNTPITRRERQRKTSERQRGTSTSTLAASVGLQCPLTPSGIRDGGSANWHAGERLSQANLDGIVFPGVLPTGSGGEATAMGPSEPLVTDGQIRQSLSDTTIFEDTERNLFRPRGFSLEMIDDIKHQNVSRSLTETTTPASQPTPPPISPDWSRTAPSPPPTSHSTLHQKLLSLRISESSLFSSTDQQHLETGTSQEDEVFLQNPPCPSPPKSPSSAEDFPPPPSSDLDQQAGNQAGGRFVLTCAHSSKVRTRLCGCCINYYYCYDYQELTAPFTPNIPFFFCPLSTQSSLSLGATAPQYYL